ncbi:MAG: hypothetical protein LC790_18275 [Actinobacteria bacterium]|nr:hypothetical protein [Actinomycetota bacterium]
MARTADRTLTLVLDPDDDVDTLARLRRLHARPLGYVVCEPAPGGGSSGLARSLLAALGKTLDLEPAREPLWRLVNIHLRAEQTRQLIVLRAHTLTYPALHRLAGHADAAGAQLWLVVHQDRPPGPVAQLLEALPHQTTSLQALLKHTPELAEADTDEHVPLGAGLEFPYLSAIDNVFDPMPRRRVRLTLTHGLPRRDRAAVYDTFDQAHDWTLRWLDEHAEWTYQDAADAVLALARRGDTASEIYVRIRAALDALDRTGIDTNVDAVDRVFERSFGETRPCQLNAAVSRAAVSRAAALADQSADPRLAALIAVAVLARCPHYIRLANFRGLASDGAVLAGPWGGALTIPPELRRFLATWHDERKPRATAQAIPLFPGNSHGRASQPAIRRHLTRLNAPASLWEDPPDTTIGEGAGADGRALLLRLSAWHLWLDRPDHPADTGRA